MYKVVAVIDRLQN